MGSKKSTFVPFANEADVLEIGNLSIENRLDRVTLNGEIDLTLDQPGLAKARLLHRVLGDVLAALEAQQLPDTLPPPIVKTVDNPFI